MKQESKWKEFMLLFQYSLFFQWLGKCSKQISQQWKESKIITAFLTPIPWEREVGKNSVFYKLWLGTQKGGNQVYDKLKLEKLMDGSVFTRHFFWAMFATALAPFLPTMGLLALALVATLSFLLNSVRYPQSKLMFAPMNRYIILYALLYLVMTFLSATPSSSLLVGLVTCVFVLFAVVLQNTAVTQKDIRIALGIFAFAGVFVSLYGIYQYIFRTGYQSSAWVDSEMFDSISFRVASTLDNPNMLGQYLILVIPFTGACLLAAKDWGQRVFWLAIAAIECLCMVLTFSRGAWLGLLFAGALFFVMLNPRLIYLLPVVLVGLYFVLPPSVVERFTSIGDLGDASTSYRVFIWIGTLAMLSDYWVCGVGAGDEAFNLVYPVYSYDSIVAPHSHNLFLQIVCDGGFFLLIVFLLFLFHYFRGLAVSMKHSESWAGKLYQIAAFSSVAGFMVQAMTDYSFYNYRVMFLFWVVVGIGGLAMSYDRLPKEKVSS